MCEFLVSKQLTKSVLTLQKTFRSMQVLRFANGCRNCLLELLFTKATNLAQRRLRNNLEKHFNGDLDRRGFGLTPALAILSRPSVIQGVHKVLHTFKILISQKLHKAQTLNF